MDEKQRKTYSVRLYNEVMKEVRILAVKEETTLSALLEEAIKDLLKKHSANAKASKKKK